ncbi:MAG: hypothetical protein LBM28_02110 [Oscillospiraceae bacterium]|jgi:protein-tyrosine phosphatase|nr:hypothetical protein [Oscillospiraceae bacterium]
MVDLHCHIIPGIDDGAQSAGMACRMAEKALRSGVDTIVATPHCNLSATIGNYRGRRYTEAFEMFRALLRQRGIPIKILPGAEIYARSSNLKWLLQQDKLITLNRSRYLLTEFSFNSSGAHIQSLLRIIAKHGLTPVIAHPERYEAVQRSPQLVANWFSQGCIIQLNKGSLLGLLGNSPQLTALHLLEHGLAHVIASDAHDLERRTAGLSSLLPLLERYCAGEYVDLLLRTNPTRIIRDEQIPMPTI